MKKTITILLTLILTLSLAACAAKQPAADSSAVEIPDAKTLLDTVWARYSEDDKFPAMGGDFAGKYDRRRARRVLRRRCV